MISTYNKLSEFQDLPELSIDATTKLVAIHGVPADNVNIPVTTLIEDTLTNPSTVRALSANQGKVLNETKVGLTGNETIAGNKTFTGVTSGITKAMVGLTNADDTSDTNKPISTLTQNALNLKANIESPVLTGVPQAPTASAGSNTTQIATTAFVTAANGGKATTASPAFTGVPTAPTAIPGTSTTQIATTEFVTTADNLKAPINSPTFTGAPTCPTATVGNNTTQIATTAFVKTQIDNDIFNTTKIVKTNTVVNFVTEFPSSGYEGNYYYNTITNEFKYGTLYDLVPAGLNVGVVYIDSVTNEQWIYDGSILFKFKKVDIINSLNSTSIYSALSAAQGKTLNDTKAPTSSPVFTNSFTTQIREYSASTTLGNLDHIVITTNDVQLPSANSIPGRQYIIKNIRTSGTGNINVYLSAGDLIDGSSSTFSLPEMEVLRICSGGDNWFKI